MPPLSAPLRGVVIGCGFFSRIQMEAWNRLRDLVTITACCDADAERAAQFARDFEIPKSYSDAAMMLDAQKPQFVDIVTRPDTHRPLAETAAARGIHVLCQKPFAPTLEESEALVAACDQANVRLMVNENWRWQAWYREIHRLLAEDALGAPRKVTWIHSHNDGFDHNFYRAQPYFADMPRFLVYETLVHYLDTARFLFGEPTPLRCHTRRQNPRIKGEDRADIRLYFPSALEVWIRGTRCGDVYENGAAMGRCQIDGSRGTLVMMGDGSLYLNGERTPFTPPLEGYRGDSCLATQKHFALSLLQSTPFESNGPDYLKSFRLMELCYQSAATCSTISV